jgi:hypothetical protein
MYTKMINYRCDCCTVVYDEKEVIVDEYGTYCPECGDEVAAIGEREADWVSVALYNTSRCYGGPEEGGWYYTMGSMVKPTLRCFDNINDAQAYYDELSARNAGEIKFQQIRVYRETIAPLTFPTNRPRYS